MWIGLGWNGLVNGKIYFGKGRDEKRFREKRMRE